MNITTKDQMHILKWSNDIVIYYLKSKYNYSSFFTTKTIE